MTFLSETRKECFFLDKVCDHGATLYMCSLTMTPCHYHKNISECDCAVPNYIIADRVLSLLGCKQV